MGLAVVNRVVGDGGFLALPVGLAVEDEFVRGRLEPVDRGLGEEDIASRRADFDAAVALVKSLEQPPADVEAPWEYVYNSQFEFTGDLGDDAVSAPAREGLLIRHVVRLLLATLPST